MAESAEKVGARVEPGGMASTKRAYVETYGCQMNLADGELMEGLLEAQGYELVSDPAQADVILVNTCAVREHAERRVLGRVAQLRGLRAENPRLILGVTGCMAQRMGEALLEKAPGVDLVLGPDGYRRLPLALQAVEAGRGEPSRGGLTLLDLDPAETYEGLEMRRSSGVSAWVPIQRGCDHRCTFCIVPYVRGPEKNRAPEAVMAEVRELAERGVTEVTLLGQTVNSYRWGDWTFPRLLEAVARVEGIRRVRFTSPHPNDVTPELVEVMAREPAVCEQLHLPLQSGSDRVLKRMLRRHTVEAYLKKVELVRAAVPDVALTTDLMVAFPGETEEDFRRTLEVVEAVRFDDAFTYRFSPREGTPATRLPSEWFLSPEEGRARLEALIALVRRIQTEINRAEVGRMEEVLVERRGKEPGTMLGKTRRGKVAVFPAAEETMGSYRRVQLVRTTGATFVGRMVAESVGPEGS